jgi:ribosome-binding protein aMBF1 (putative translation factor)
MKCEICGKENPEWKRERKKKGEIMHICEACLMARPDRATFIDNYKFIG